MKTSNEPASFRNSAQLGLACWYAADSSYCRGMAQRSSKNETMRPWVTYNYMECWLYLNMAPLQTVRVNRLEEPKFHVTHSRKPFVSGPNHLFCVLRTLKEDQKFELNKSK